MKIAVSGSACTGKTTLAQELAQRLSLPYIPEYYDALFDPPGTYSESSLDVLVILFNKVLEKKHAEEERLGKFIVDRCPVDLMNLWLSRGLSRERKDSKVLYMRCAEYMQHYDYVIVPPWGSIPLRPLENPVGRQRRAMNPWVLLRNHATILGLVRMWVPGRRVITLPRDLTSTEARIEFILRRTGKAG